MKKLIYILFFISVCFAKEVTVISSLPLSGFNKDNGLSIKNGANLYFDNFNKKSENKINFTTYDDSSRADKFKVNIMENLRDTTVVFMPIDTIDVRQIVPEILRDQIVIFSPLTGASFLNFSVFESVINTRPSFEFEMESVVDYFYREDVKNIGLVYQSGEHGEEIYNSLAKALDKRNLKIYSSLSYKKNSNVIDPIIENILTEKADIVIFAIVDDVAIDIINKMNRHDIKTKFVLLNEVDLSKIYKPERIYTSTFTPTFNETKEQANLYTKLLKKKNLSQEACSYSAFLNAFLISEVFTRLDFKLTNKSNLIKESKQVVNKYRFFDTNRIRKFDERGKETILYMRKKL